MSLRYRPNAARSLVLAHAQTRAGCAPSAGALPWDAMTQRWRAAVPLPAPLLDHVVIDVRDRMDEAAHVFTALGFSLTPRGHHTLGSTNHLAMFATDYLELLGFGEGGASRDELQSFPIGLNGLVFK